MNVQFWEKKIVIEVLETKDIIDEIKNLLDRLNNKNTAEWRYGKLVDI